MPLVLAARVHGAFSPFCAWSQAFRVEEMVRVSVDGVVASVCVALWLVRVLGVFAQAAALN